MELLLLLLSVVVLLLLHLDGLLHDLHRAASPLRRRRWMAAMRVHLRRVRHHRVHQLLVVPPQFRLLLLLLWHRVNDGDVGLLRRRRRRGCCWVGRRLRGRRRVVGRRDIGLGRGRRSRSRFGRRGRRRDGVVVIDRRVVRLVDAAVVGRGRRRLVALHRGGGLVGGTAAPGRGGHGDALVLGGALAEDGLLHLDLERTQ